MTKFLIAGLGNVGVEYEGTRHNIGFDVVDAFVKAREGSFRLDRLAFVADLKWKGKQFTCIKPTTFMNLSGKALKYWMDKENIPLERVLVIMDDLALPLDKVRIRPSGTDAGHNGLKSIQEILSTDQYPRLRFGIGNDFPKGMQIEYVLGKWKAEETALIRYKIDKCIEIIEGFAVSGLERIMNQYNKLSFTL